MFSDFHLLLLMLFLKMFRFHGGAITNNVVMRKFKACPTLFALFESINHVKIYPLSENLDIFEADNICSYNQNYDHMLNTFYSPRSKSF